MTGKTAGASFEVRDNAGIPEHRKPTEMNELTS